MNEFLRYRFLVDSGVDVLFKREISSLQCSYQFSDDYFRFLLISSGSSLVQTSTEVSFFDLSVHNTSETLEEVNEDSIFSPYIFIIGRWSRDMLIGEVLVGDRKGAIVLIAEDKICDIDSIEELLEDMDVEDIHIALKNDGDTVTALLSDGSGVMTVLEHSFYEFLDNRLLLAS